ncbi:dihydrodipicolinate synthase family protein [Christensenellaceae bacterium OttesenSCG-928-M15]|nr:dihydrodipicolinate synthase family protein [Christensenellaceae bacterium OttesenSCG-928-M15]
MKDVSKYSGVFPAFYACYDESGEISTAGVRALTRHLLKKGVKGLYVGGSSGECVYQSVEERKLVLEQVMEEAAGSAVVIAHVACNNTRDSRTLAAHAQDLGVDAIAAIPPIYFKLPEYAIARYWNDISAAAPDTDFIIYNIPQLAGVALTMPLLKEMRKNERVIGVKNSSAPVQDIQMFKEEGGEGFVVFNGPDEQFVSGLMAGADGGIGGTYAVMPELFIKARELFLAGDILNARALQNEICRIIYAMCAAKGNLYAVMKAILRTQGLQLGGVRSPLCDLFAQDQEIVLACAKRISQAVNAYTG